MSRPSRPLYVSEIERELLEKELRRSNLLGKYIPRMKIVLLSGSGTSNEEVSTLVGVSLRTVIKWRSRWIESYDFLQTAKQGVEGNALKGKDLLSLMRVILDDAERSGAPKTITEEHHHQIQAIACSKPSNYGYPITHWTHKELTKVVIDQGVIDSISVSYVGRILKKRISTT